MRLLDKRRAPLLRKSKPARREVKAFAPRESRRTLNEAIDGRKIKPPGSLICELKYSCAHGS